MLFHETPLAPGDSTTGATLAIFYADFLAVHCKDAPAARQVYDQALKRWKGLRYLWEGAIHLEEHLLGADREGKLAPTEFCSERLPACIECACLTPLFPFPSNPLVNTPALEHSLFKISCFISG